MNKDRSLADYLLGKLDQPDCETLEEQYFADAESLEEIAAMQEELFDDYLSGKLPDADRLRFEQRFIQTDAGRSHLRFVQGLFDWTALRRSHRPWFFLSWRPEIQPVMGQQSSVAPASPSGAGSLVLDIPADGSLVVEMQLTRESPRSDYQDYQFVLNQSAANEIWRSEVLSGRGMDSRPRAEIPRALLREGQFILTALGRTTAGEPHPLLEQIIIFRKA